ncbi:MAG: MFS transporter [Myxococcaceae bacterium]
MTQKTSPIPLRVSLRASTWEAVGAEVLTACVGSTVLTAWAIHLGLSPLALAALAAAPHLAQVLQFPAAWITTLSGYRRTTLVSLSAARQVYWGLAVLPWLDVSVSTQRWMLLCIAGAAATLGVVGNNGWVAWMGELVPTRLRGRYFARRTAVGALSGALASLLAGALLDAAAARGQAGLVLSLLGLVACTVGAFTTLMLARKGCPAPPAAAPPTWASTVAVLRDANIRPVLHYQAAWHSAIGFSSAFFALHLVDNLGLGFVFVALYHGILHATRMFSVGVWGGAVDRFGTKPVLVACSIGLTPLPLLWLAPAPLRALILPFDAAIAGTLLAGHGLAMLTLPLAFSPRAQRPFYVATFSAVGGVALALGAAVAGLLAHLLPVSLVLGGARFYGLEVLFVISAVLRASASWRSAHLLEPRAKPTADLMRWMQLGAKERLAGVRFAAMMIRR